MVRRVAVGVVLGPATSDYDVGQRALYILGRSENATVVVGHAVEKKFARSMATLDFVAHNREMLEHHLML